MLQRAGLKAILIPMANTVLIVIGQATVVKPGNVVNVGAQKPREQPRKPPEPPHNGAEDRPSTVQRRHNYEHARRRTTDKISELSGVESAIYLFLRKLNDTERDFFNEVKTYLTKDSKYFTNASCATSDH